MDPQKKLTYVEYLAFLMLFAAYADQNLSKEEILDIIDHIGKAEYVKMKELILSMNDQQRIDLILEHKKEFLVSADKVDQALADIKEVFLSDQIFTQVEKFHYHFLSNFLRKE